MKKLLFIIGLTLLLSCDNNEDVETIECYECETRLEHWKMVSMSVEKEQKTMCVTPRELEIYLQDNNWGVIICDDLYNGKPARWDSCFTVCNKIAN